MALTITSRGTGTHNTGATTLVPGGRSATLAAGSLGVLAIALDNAGTNGDTAISPSTWTDAKGNLWTLRLNAIYDNGIASTGVEMSWYTADIVTALLTTDLGTITWLGPTAVTAKVWTWYEAIPSASHRATYVGNGSIAGATAANATVVTASVPVGDGVIAGYFAENVAAVTGDADATNGSWTAQQTTTVGSTTAGLRIATQQKVQTTTPSTQSYDVTVSSQDRIAGYIQVADTAIIVATPGVVALTLTPIIPYVGAAPLVTVVNRGSGGRNSAITTCDFTGRTATLAVGSMGVLCIAVDNSIVGGAGFVGPTSFTDAKGNTWTRRMNQNYDPSSTEQGIEAVWYTCEITTALLTTDACQATWAGGVAPPAAAWTFYEATPPTGYTMTYTTRGFVAGATAADGQVTTGTIAVGDVVIAGYFAENSNPVTGDSDTTNGNWTTQQSTTGGGAGVSGVILGTQAKVQTTTASTQSYDVTVASQDRLVGYIVLHLTPQVPTTALTLTTFAPTIRLNKIATPPTLALTLTTFVPQARAPRLATPPVKTLTLATFAPTVLLGKIATPPVKTLTLTTFAPTIALNKIATPPVKALLLTTFAPTVVAPRLVIPPVKALTITTFAPTIRLNKIATPPVKTLALTTFAPVVATPRLVTPPVKTLSLTTFAPTIRLNKITTPPTKALTLATFAPTVSAPRLATPSTKTLALTTFAPVVAAPRLVTPATKTLAITVFAPTVLTPRLVTPGTKTLTLTTFAPTVAITNHKVAIPPTKALSLSTFAPVVSVSDNRRVTVGLVALTLTTFAPTVATTAHRTVVPAPAALALTTFAPSVAASASVVVTPAPAALVLTDLDPDVTFTAHVVVVPDLAVLLLASDPPGVLATQAGTIVTGTAELTITTFAPVVTAIGTVVVTPAPAVLSLTSFAPTVLTSDNILVVVGLASLVLTGYPPHVTAFLSAWRVVQGGVEVPVVVRIV